MRDPACSFPIVDALHLTEALREAYEAGYWDGYTDRQPEVDQAQADAGRYYRHAYNSTVPRPTRRRN